MYRVEYWSFIDGVFTLIKIVNYGIDESMLYHGE